MVKIVIERDAPVDGAVDIVVVPFEIAAFPPAYTSQT
jgi:hypothetical protein